MNENNQHVSDEVTVRLEDGPDIAIGRGSSEEEALAVANAELARFRAEQNLLNSPAVAAARAALAEAMRLAREDA